MRFGTFIAPHIPPDIHPAICMDYNMDLVRQAKIDQYGAEKGSDSLNPDIVAHFRQ